MSAPSGSQGVLAALQVSPDAATLQVGASTQLSASLRDSSGGVLTDHLVAWTTESISVADVNASGLVTAKAPGTSRIIASSSGKSDTALITVTADPPAPVAAITISPSPASVDSGKAVQLTATLRDASGGVLSGRSVSWTSIDASIATVSTSGLVSGHVPGVAHIIAASEGQADTTAVTVLPVASRGAEIDTIFYDGFESGNLSLWQDGVDPTHQVVRNGTIAEGGTHYLEMTLPAGETDAWLTRFFMPGYDSVYVRMYVRYPSSWSGGSKMFALRGSPTDNQWGGFGNAGKCPSGTDFFSSNLTTESDLDPGPVHFYAYYFGMPSSGGVCWGSNGDANTSYTHASSGLTHDVWHKVEYWVKLNAPASQDAVQRFWIDGVLWGEWSGISFRTTSNLKLNALQLQLQNAGHSVYYDDVLVATAKPTP